jgi:putative OPT family oligopeptide transporter
VILGALITVVLTAANVYAGLKIGLTVATSIPAAVISMAILRFFRDSTIRRIISSRRSFGGWNVVGDRFRAPGLVMVGWWTGFPYWLSVAVIAIGGILGVMYSVPLRRALVTGTDLPFEGVAAAEVLKVGTGVGGVEENRRGLRMIVWSSVVAAVFAALAQTRLLVGEVAKAFKFGSGATAASTSLSMLLIGVGHLVGLAVGIAMFVGLLISWVFLVPHYTSLAGQPAGVELGTFVNGIFRNQVRFIGAGAIGVAAIWTLLRILGPIISGVRAPWRRTASARPGAAIRCP